VISNCRLQKGSTAVTGERFHRPAEFRQTSQRLLQVHPHGERCPIRAAIDYLAKNKRVVQLNLESRPDRHRVFQLETYSACGYILDKGLKRRVDVSKKGDRYGSIGWNARFEPLLHIPLIVGNLEKFSGTQAAP
jgi:hypothetical protein